LESGEFEENNAMRRREKSKTNGSLIALKRRRWQNSSTGFHNAMRILSAVWFVHVGVAAAAPPANVTLDPEMHEWFKSLAQPGTQKPCCSISDCRFTEYKERDGHFEIVINGWPYTVPDHVILRTIKSPKAGAVVCYEYSSFGPPMLRGVARTSPQDTIEILCFVPEHSIS
jgi:hypothetical protein